jgi:hypothetical protein
MTSETEAALLETILNDLDITFEDEKLKAKIKRNMESGAAYLEDKAGSEIDFEEDKIALDLLISYCRYGRSNAIEQFEHDFASNLTAFALRAAVQKAQAQEGAEDESEV